MSAEGLAKLREEFPAGTVGKLPKPKNRDAQRGHCNECGGYHGLPAVHLDFVGHAAVTDRLLTVDPEWSWEPMGFTAEGLPALDREGNLWIRLTVCGVTRVGVGDGSSAKERIGDAIRNAAMRFGVALSLWTKDELESGHSDEKPTASPSAPSPAPQTPDGMVQAGEAKNRLLKKMSPAEMKQAWGDRGNDPISEEDLKALLPAEPQSLGNDETDPTRPFEQGEMTNA